MTDKETPEEDELDKLALRNDSEPSEEIKTVFDPDTNEDKQEKIA